MSYRKPFRAVPIREGRRYRQAREQRQQSTAARFLSGAALAGAVVGLGSVAATESGRSIIVDTMKPIAVSAGIVRANSPLPGAYYPGCDAARAAGVAPLFAGEPGYREDMDGDLDGIACEPHRSLY